MLNNLAKIVHSQRLSQEFQIIRNHGQIVDGYFEKTMEITLNAWGAIVPEKTKDVNMTPNGDQITGYINVYTETPLLTTHNGEGTEQSHNADRIKWRGELYKVMSAENLRDYGFWQARCVRIKGG